MAIDEKGKLNQLITMNSVGLPVLMETWQRAAGIDPALWNIGLAGTTGTVVRSEAEEPYQKVILAGAANADVARLYTTVKWQLAPDTWGLNTFQKALVMEWECKFAVVAAIENTTFFMGLAAGAAATRAAMNLAGFCLTADALNALTDDGGAETVSAVGAPVVTNWMKLTVLAYRGCIEFYVNEVMRARHTTAAPDENLPDVNVYGMFYLPQEALAVWVGLTAYGLGVFVRPTVENGFRYEATTAGTTAAGEPAWPLVLGNTVVDGTVTWTCRARGELHLGDINIRPGVIL